MQLICLFPTLKENTFVNKICQAKGIFSSGIAYLASA